MNMHPKHGPLYPEALAFVDSLRELRQIDGAVWFEREMLLAFERGHFQFIPTRDKTNVYLGRFWLTPVIDGGESWESGNSWLLHHFFRPDDDKALHSHPWPFETEVLRGGYVEALPPLDWSPASRLGPAFDARHLFMDRGMRGRHDTNDLHAVAEIQKGTVTSVRTGPRVDTWYFHPPGEPRVHYRRFLDTHAKV